MKGPVGDLEREYNARATIPEHPQILAKWARESAGLRESLPGRLDLAYGDDPGERLDWFPVDVTGPRPLLFFVHGGYWRSLDKDDFTYLVPGLQRLGLDVVLVNYGLCPRVSVAEIVAQVRRGLAWTHANAPGMGADPARIHLAGHSAGGHLVAMLMATDWAATGQAAVGAAIRGGLAISGVYDLAPLLETSINVEARLDADSARAVSPLWRAPTVMAPLDLAVGGDESREFKRQAEALAAAWGICDGPHLVPETHHFSVLEGLGEPGGLPWRLLERRLATR